MPIKRGIVYGQRINPQKLALAKKMRLEMTPAEKHLWHALRGDQLDGYHFRRQQLIDGFIADFYCHAAGLVIEVDGLIHKTQLIYDKDREQHFATRGLYTLRFMNEQIKDELEVCLAKIQQICHARTDPSP